jgi:hypothetical protein
MPSVFAKARELAAASRPNADAPSPAVTSASAALLGAPPSKSNGATAARPAGLASKDAAKSAKSIQPVSNTLKLAVGNDASRATDYAYINNPRATDAPSAGDFASKLGGKGGAAAGGAGGGAGGTVSRAAIEELLEEMALLHETSMPDRSLHGHALDGWYRERMGAATAASHNGDTSGAVTEYARAYVATRRAPALAALIAIRLRGGDVFFAHAAYTHLLSDVTACAELKPAELAKLRRRAADVCYQLLEVLVVEAIAPIAGQPAEAGVDDLLFAADEQLEPDLRLAATLYCQAFRLQLRAYRTELAEAMADESEIGSQGVAERDAQLGRARDAAGIGARALSLGPLLRALDAFGGLEQVQCLFAWAALAFILDAGGSRLVAVLLAAAAGCGWGVCACWGWGCRCCCGLCGGVAPSPAPPLPPAPSPATLLLLCVDV